MNVFVALYWGINVGGKNSVPMQSLRAMHERLGHRGVQSYLQSGNIVFSANGLAAGHARKITAEFTAAFGFAAQVMVIDASRWRTIIAANPYAKLAAENPQSVHVGICSGEPSVSDLEALLVKTGGHERFVAGVGVIYLHAPDGIGKSKFAAGLERASGAPMTLRNWRTVAAIGTLANGAQ